jgi:hypothetical protein
MSSTPIVCAMCGYTFDPEAHASCQACPLSKGCTLVCCPNCGFETVNPEQSKLARIASLLFSLNTRKKQAHLEKEQ